VLNGHAEHHLKIAVQLRRVFRYAINVTVRRVVD
jgi:hypothetical protein